MSGYNAVPLQRALRFLAAACDGAHDRDGAGFNRFDADFGHKLAVLPYWSPRQTVAAYKLGRKYRRQLEEGGIRFGSIPVPPGVSDAR